MIGNPYSAYKRQSVQTMTNVEVVIKLYSEIEKQMAIGVNATEHNDYKTANESFFKAQECINALRSVLDLSIPISRNLDSLYEFFNRECVKANLKKDVTEIKKIIPMISELKDAFVQINAMPKDQLQSQAASNQ